MIKKQQQTNRKKPLRAIFKPLCMFGDNPSVFFKFQAQESFEDK